MAVNIKKDFGTTRNRKPDISNLVYGKVPPQDTSAESAVLGAIMLEKDALEDVINILPSADCFYMDAHQKIYNAILAVYHSGGYVDLVTVTSELVKTSELELIGGAYYLTQLTASVVTSAHVVAHSFIIKEKFLLRELIRISGMTISDGYDNSTDPIDLMDRVQQELSDLQQSSIKKEPVHVGKVSKEVNSEVQIKRESKAEFSGMSTGYQTLDEHLDGIETTNFIVIGARPAVGKTSFVLNLAMNMAQASNPVALFSLEMRNAELIKRMHAAVSGIKLKNIKVPNRMSEDEYLEYMRISKQIEKLNIFIDDTAGITVSELKSKARKLKKKYGIKTVIIDYLQLMQGDSRSGNREQEISKISRDLKQLAKDLDVAVIALSQLNRVVDSQKDNVPKLSQLRESGAIEQDADVVMLMYRASKEEESKIPALRGPVNINIAKNRHGDAHEVVLYFERDNQRWHNSMPVEPFKAQEQPENHYRTMQNVPHTMFNNANQGGSNKPENIDDLPF